MNLFKLAFALALPLLFLIPQLSFSQEKESSFTLSGTVWADKNNGLQGANVLLLNAKDSVQIKGMLSDAQGKFVFQALPKGDYLLKISYIGFDAFTSKVLKLGADLNLAPILMQAGAAQLQGVAIVGTVPLFEQQLDKMVINVAQNVTSAGNSALEVLEKSPGITVDPNGTISMRGKQGVIVLINGKPTQLTGPDLAELLKGMPAGNIQKIDLINIPSAKFDAAGSAGVIDIKLRRDKRSGFNGNVSLNIGQGNKFKSNNGANLNYQLQKWSFFGNYNYAHRGDFGKFTNDRIYEGNLQSLGGFSQAYDQDIKYRSHISRIGADYQLNNNVIFGLEIFGNFIGIDRITDSRTQLSNAQQTPSGFRNTFNATVNGRKNYGININYTEKLDTLGSSLGIDFDQATYTLDDQQSYQTHYLAPDGQALQNPYLLHNDADGKLQIYSGAINYSKKINKFTVEGGLKSSQTTSQTGLFFFDQSNGNDVFDPSLSNRFRYEEHVQAGYLNLATQTQRIDAQIGLRIENTVSKALQITTNEALKWQYTNLFPSAAFGYRLTTQHRVGINFSRRINRPTYNQINPYFYFLDVSTRFSGNPNLRAATNYSVDLSYSWKGKYILTLNYFSAKLPIVDAQLKDKTDPKIIIQQPVNLEQNKDYSLTLTLPFTFAKWYTLNANLSVVKSRFKGQIDNESFQTKKTYGNFNLMNSFNYQTWSLQVVANYIGRQYVGRAVIEPILTFSGGIRKRIFNQKASIGLNINDVFNSNSYNSNNIAANYINRSTWRRDTRFAMFNFTYRFGSNEQPTKRKTGSAEDEKRRAG